MVVYCLFCKIDFEAKLLRAKFCSDKCRMDNYYENNKERVSAKSKEYRESNKISVAKQKKCWQIKNKDYLTEYQKDWTNKNKHLKCANEAKRRATKLNATPNDLTVEDLNKIKVIYNEARKLTKETGIQYVVDHIMPLSKGGLHHPYNLQIMTAQENREKYNKVV